jgi:hypothetical protein
MKRIVITVVFLAALPLLASTNSPSGIAFAGHTTGGNWCQCGCPACLCDPGDQIDLCIPGAADDAIPTATAPSRSDNSSGTAAAMLIGAVGLLWKRFRR